MRGTWTILLLITSNVLITLAWYGHLRFNQHATLAKSGPGGVVLMSWGRVLK